MLWLAGLSAAVSPLFTGIVLRANVITVPNGTTDLTSLGATSATDLEFTPSTAYSPAAFTDNSNLSLESLDDTDGTAPALSISNTGSDTLTVGGGGNAVAPSTSDLLYVVGGGSLTINGGVAGSGTVTNTISFGAAGNLDIAGAATITSQLASTHLLTVTGGGTLNLGPASSAATGNSGLTGGFAIQNGTVNLGGATNEPEFDLGPSNGTVTVGGSASNSATLNIQVPTANFLENMVIASTGTSTISSSATGGTVTFLTGSFVLNNNLTVADTSSTGTLGFRNVITQVGGPWGITVGSSNAGTVTFQALSTFGGGVTIDSGTALFNTTSSGGPPPTSGPAGTGTVTLGGLSTSSAILALGSGINLGNPIVVGTANNGITRTATTSGTGTAVLGGVGTMVLDSNLNLEATNSAGAIRLTDVISQSGGPWGITVDSNNVGTIDFREANTFGGGVTIDSGTVTFNTTNSSPLTGTVTSGPFGTGTITLGATAAATTLNSGGAFTIANPIAVDNSSSTIGINNATSTAGVFNGSISLGANNLTLASVSGANAGNDRVRFGSGGITGSGNITINDAAYTLGANDGAIQMQGSTSATAWTGNLIVSTGLGSLGGANGVNAVGAANTVTVNSGALFAFTSNTGNAASFGFSPTIAGLTGAGTVDEITSSNQTLNLGGSGNYSFSGTIADSTTATFTAALNVNLGAGGTQTLSGNSTYSGGTTVNGGSLVLINLISTSATGSGAVALSGGALEGTGYSTGALTVTNGAVIAPGVNTSGTNNDFGVVGMLNLGTTGGITLTNATLDFDMATLASGSSDEILTGGALNIGTANFVFNELGGSLDTSGATYTLIAGATSVSDPLPTATFVNGPDYTANFSFSGNNLVVSFSPVPEPATLGLFGASGLVLLARRRRKA